MYLQGLGELQGDQIQNLKKRTRYDGLMAKLLQEHHFLCT